MFKYIDFLCISPQRIQEPGVTEADILLLNADYRNEFKHLKQLTEKFEKLVKEEYEESEFKEDVDLYQSQLISVQTFFRCDASDYLYNTHYIFHFV